MTPRQPKDMHTDPDLQLGEEAAEWFLRMRSGTPEPDETYPDPKECLAAFKAWLEQSPEHQHAYRQIEQLHQAAFQLTPPASFDIHALLKKVAAPHRQTQRLRGSKFAKIALAASLVACVLILPLIGQNSQASTHYYSSGVGERQVIQLEDGSSITLNTRSKIAVFFNPREREVRLLSGEALFRVQHDADRPFRVISNGALLEDVGTEFSVYSRKDGITVSVVSGKIRLYCDCMKVTSDSPAPSTKNPSITPSTSVVMGPNDQAEITQGPGSDRFSERHLTATEMQNAIAWRDGVISFNNIPLARAIEEFNRYNRQRIVVLDASISTRLVSGRFESPSIPHFLSALSGTYDITSIPNTADGSIRLVPAPISSHTALEDK
jgi:transmembrane sensor